MTAGHTPYGLFQEHLPPGTRYVTFLRDPVERVLSHYHNYIRLTGTPLDQPRLERGRVLTDSIEEALEMGLPELSNLATRFLCGHPSPLGELPASALDDAQANLHHFALVGIQERFEESAVLLQRTFGLGLVPYINRHTSVGRPTAGEIPNEQRAEIAEHNRLDAELYEYAQGLFNAAVADADEGFAADVETLRVTSAAANEEATQKARDWITRELPAGIPKPKTEILAEAEAAGVPRAALKTVLKLLSVQTEFDEDGRMIWSRPEEVNGGTSRTGSDGSRERVVTGADGVTRVVAR